MSRGSRKRLRKIKVQQNTPRWLVIFGVVLVISMLLAIRWLMDHPFPHSH